MRISSGFDRIASPEELNQVLAVLDELARNAWIPEEAQLQETSSSSPATLWADIEDTGDDSDEDQCLAEFISDKNLLKN